MTGAAHLITGATGNAGGAVVRALVAAGEPVRALVRPGAQTAALGDRVELVEGDLNQPASFGERLGRVRAAFLLSGYERLEETLRLLRDAGAERVVLLSSSAAPGGDLGNAIARYHILSERAVRASGLPWTFLQPNSFMSNTFRWLPQLRAGDTIRIPFADVPIATIDPADMAAVAVVAMTGDALAGRSLRLSGPQALLPAEQAEILGAALGRDLRVEGLSNDRARAEMSASMPAEYVDAFFDFFAAGSIDETTVQPAVAEILGRAPRPFERWVAENTAAFR